MASSKHSWGNNLPYDAACLGSIGLLNPMCVRNMLCKCTEL